MKDNLLKRKEELQKVLEAHVNRRNEIQRVSEQELAQHNATLGRLAEVEHLLSLEDAKEEVEHLEG